MTLLMIAQEWYASSPGSLYFILLLSTIIAIASVILTKLLVNTAELERKQKKIKENNEFTFYVKALTSCNYFIVFFKESKCVFFIYIF